MLSDLHCVPWFVFEIFSNCIFLDCDLIFERILDEYLKGECWAVYEERIRRVVLFEISRLNGLNGHPPCS